MAKPFRTQEAKEVLDQHLVLQKKIIGIRKIHRKGS